MNKRLKMIRTESRLNQADFSKRLGMAQSTYAALESGKTKIRDRHINLICSTFNVNNDWLITGKGEMFKEDLVEQVGVEVARLFSNGDDLTKKLILGLSELDESEIEIVKILVDGLINKKKQS
jgi:transcriptional regulator with XRE-family HTH domain